MNRTLRGNPELAAQRKAVEAALQRPSQIKALPDPTASLEIMALRADRLGSSDALDRGISLGVTQVVPLARKRGLRALEAERQAQVARLRLTVLESELRGEVLSTAFRHALSCHLLDINERTQRALQAASTGAAAAYAAGAGSQADVLLAQTALTKNRTERKELEFQRSVAEARLAELSGGQVDSAALAQVELPDPEPLPPLESLTAEIERHAPGLRQSEADADVEGVRVDLARENFKPDLILGARYRYRDMSMGGQDYFTAMVGITLPFFHKKSRYEPALRESLLRQDQATRRTEAARTKVLYQLSEAYQSALRDQGVHELLKQGLLIQSQKAYEASLAAYSVGKADFTTLLGALSNHFRYEGQAEMAKAGYQEALARIQATLGLSSFRTAGSEPPPAPLPGKEVTP